MDWIFRALLISLRFIRKIDTENWISDEWIFRKDGKINKQKDTFEEPNARQNITWWFWKSWHYDMLCNIRQIWYIPHFRENEKAAGIKYQKRLMTYALPRLRRLTKESLFNKMVLFYIIPTEWKQIWASRYLTERLGKADRFWCLGTLQIGLHTPFFVVISNLGFKIYR